MLYLLVAPMLAAAYSLLATNVYNLMFLYHICIGKINELVLFRSVLRHKYMSTSH